MMYTDYHRNMTKTIKNKGSLTIRDALMAGNTPPMKLTAIEKMIDWTAISAVIVKEKASSEKACKFSVEIVINCTKEAKKDLSVHQQAPGAWIP